MRIETDTEIETRNYLLASIEELWMWLNETAQEGNSWWVSYPGKNMMNQESGQSEDRPLDKEGCSVLEVGNVTDRDATLSWSRNVTCSSERPSICKRGTFCFYLAVSYNKDNLATTI